MKKLINDILDYKLYIINRNYELKLIFLNSNKIFNCFNFSLIEEKKYSLK